MQEQGYTSTDEIAEAVRGGKVSLRALADALGGLDPGTA
jgi:hypothetical protein